MAARLLYALGWALWTGVVLVVLAQILPEAKRRRLKQALDAYDASLRDRAPSRKRKGAEGRRSADGE